MKKQFKNVCLFLIISMSGIATFSPIVADVVAEQKQAYKNSEKLCNVTLKTGDNIIQRVTHFHKAATSAINCLYIATGSFALKNIMTFLPQNKLVRLSSKYLNYAAIPISGIYMAKALFHVGKVHALEHEYTDLERVRKVLLAKNSLAK